MKGHLAMTTNIDFLIEYALQQSGVPDEEIVHIILLKLVYFNSNQV
jgi:alkylhydroperoxidase/carboxymuconolactone decarboxylase family protein YurZ